MTDWDRGGIGAAKGEKRHVEADSEERRTYEW